MPRTAGDVQRRRAELVVDIDIRTRLGEQIDDVRMAFEGRIIERGIPVPISLLEVGTRLNQLTDLFDLGFLGCLRERRGFGSAGEKLLARSPTNPPTKTMCRTCNLTPLTCTENRPARRVHGVEHRLP